MICEGLNTNKDFDAVYLDLHGAMVTEHLQDGEGELLKRVRQVIGPDLPLVASLDLHANLTEEMMHHASAFTIYRTYPHLDMAASGARACKLLSYALSGGAIAKAFRKIPFLIPLPAQCTNFEPCGSLYRKAAELSNDNVLNVDFAAGFPPADISECGPALAAYAHDQASAERAADEMLSLVLAAEPKFVNELLSEDEAVQQAMAGEHDSPVVLADAQDNPGAGATSDTVGVLDALVRNKAHGAVIALVNDPQAAASAAAADVGAEIELSLGGKSGQANQAPYHAKFRVVGIGDGRFTCTGEMYRGAKTELGPMALLRVCDDQSDVHVIVGSERFQCLDQAVFRHLGVEPKAQRILVVKSTVHFRADFEPIAAKVLVVESPGANPCRHTNLAYQRLRNGVRLEPLGPVHTG